MLIALNFDNLKFLDLMTLKSLTTVFLLLMLAGSTAGQGITDATVVDKTDSDGDGYVTDFTVEIDANAWINEQGNQLYKGTILQAKGEPSYSIMLKENGDFLDTGTYTESDLNGDVTFEMTVSHESIERATQNGENDYAKYWANQVLNGEKEVHSFQIWFYESDTPNRIDQLSDEIVEHADIVMAEPVKFESPEEDRTAEVSIETNPGDATLYIDGEEMGETDWSGQMPVDKRERDGLVNVRIEKDGYKTVTDRVAISPPDSLDYDLEKKMRPLVIDTQPRDADATVTVNGEEIGTAPLSQDFWVEEDLNVEISADGYETKSYSGINTPQQLAVSLKSSSSSDDSLSTDYMYTPEMNYDYQINSYDLNSVDYQRDLLDNVQLQDLFAADFERSSIKISSGDAVTFDASESYHTYGNISGYKWDFGDGSTTSFRNSPTITHSYSDPGNYTVNLTVADTNGTEVSSTKHVVVENLEPKAVLNMASGKVVEGNSVTFDASNSVDTDGSISSYEWEMGDGSTLTGRQVSHTYSNEGQYTVTLEVEDDSGATSQVTRTVTVLRNNLAPRPQFSMSDTETEVNSSVSFDASASVDRDGSITDYYWDFGDGLSAKGAQATHEYRNNGTYNVNLTIVDDQRDIAFATKTVTVNSIDGQNSGSSSNDQSTGSSKTNSGDSSDSNTQQEREEEAAENSSEDQDDGEDSSGGFIRTIMDLIGGLFG